MIWWARYIGIPFVDGGRDMAGLDCWGLVRLIYQENLGIDLPDYGEISALDLISVARAIGSGRERWPAVSPPRAFDVVTMRLYDRGWVGHVGVMIDGARMIHVEKTISTAVVPIDHMTVKHRISDFRRHRWATGTA